MADEQRPASLPAVDEIEQLPQLARLALAARCARRVEPLLRLFWARLPADRLESLNRGVQLVERLVEFGRESSSVEEATSLARSMNAIAAVAPNDNAALIIYTVTDILDAVTSRSAERVRTALKTAASISSLNTKSLVQEIRADFDALISMAKAGRWNDDTQVPRDALGAIWPEGEPEGWPDEGREAAGDAEAAVGIEDGEHSLRVRVSVPDSVSYDELAEKTTQLLAAISLRHKELGGSGLKLHDLDIRSRVTSDSGGVS